MGNFSYPPLPLLMEIEICRTHIRISPTIILQTTEVLSQASKGIRLGALGSSSMLDPVTNTAHLIFKQFFHLKNYILIVVIVVTVEEFHWILLAIK